MASLILVVNVVGELQQKTTLAASRGFLAAARLSCIYIDLQYTKYWLYKILFINPEFIYSLALKLGVETTPSLKSLSSF